MSVTQTKPINQANLYEQDFYLWLTTTANLLKEGNLREIDLENLIEEIESMGRRERQAILRNLKILLMHLLKYQYQPQKRCKSWLLTIFEHRDRVSASWKDSPSLVNYVPEIFEECYQFARQKAALETDLPLITFPLESPFSIEETLNCEFLPDAKMTEKIPIKKDLTQTQFRKGWRNRVCESTRFRIVCATRIIPCFAPLLMA